MLVVWRGIPRLRGQLTCMRRQFAVAGDEHTASRSRDDLVSVEREGAYSTQRPRRAPSIRCAKRLGRVLQNCDAIPCAGAQNRIEVRALAVEVYDENGPRQAASPRPLSERILE